jgi:hypothetical protein
VKQSFMDHVTKEVQNKLNMEKPQSIGVVQSSQNGIMHDLNLRYSNCPHMARMSQP